MFIVLLEENMQELPETFDEWIDQFHSWQEKIGFDSAWIGDFEMIEIIELIDFRVTNTGNQQLNTRNQQRNEIENEQW